jgi:multiple sugar transport system permease protein
MIGPATFLIMLFGLVPIIWSLYLSFTKYDFVSTTGWAGISNYQRLLHDPGVRSAARNTILYTVLFVPLSVISGLFVAVVLNRKIRLVGLYRVAVFLPIVAPTVATAILFLYIFDPTYGIVDAGLHSVGLPHQGFLEDPSQALFVIVAMTVWGWVGFNVLVYLAALQDVPRELREAAAIDGATSWQAFRRVTLPLLRPVTLFLTVYATINALQLFDEVYVLTHGTGGPLGATMVVVLYLYNATFANFEAGYGAAIAYALFVVILVITLLQFWLGRRIQGAS